jgi:hypothetical protein
MFRTTFLFIRSRAKQFLVTFVRGLSNVPFH